MSIRVAGVPIGGMECASSRIRFFRALQFLPPGFKIVGVNEPCDVFYLQKKAKEGELDRVVRLKRQGVKIVYDIDDVFGSWPGLDAPAVIGLSDVVTTDTVSRAESLGATFPDKDIRVVPDAIDYLDKKERVSIRDSIRCVGTFGAGSNCRVALGHFGGLGLSATYICNVPVEGSEKATLTSWKLATFIAELRKLDVAFLAHPSTEAGGLKSNNRMLVCMSIGLPLVVTDTPAYRETADMVGLGDVLVLKSGETLKDKIMVLQDRSLREEISSKIIDYVWDVYNPAKSSEMWGEIFKSLVR